MHGDPVAGAGSSLKHDCPKGCGKPAPETGGRDVVDRIGKSHQVDIGILNLNEFRERPRLSVSVADLMISGCTLIAASTSATERDRDPLTRLPSLNLTSRGDDFSCKFVTGNMRQLHVRIMPHPSVPVTAAHTTRPDGDDSRIRPRNRVRNITNGKWTLKLLENRRFHQAPRTFSIAAFRQCAVQPLTAF
jgi:hypothetical protein